MFHIQTLNKISPVGLNKFDPANYTVDAPETTPDAIMVRSASMHDMEMPESLLAIARAGAGVNNIPVADCAQKGIVVFNTPGANANAVKELVLCGMLLASRKVTRAIDWCKTIKDEGDNVPKTVEKGKSAFAGPELKGKTLAVIGLGAIGRLVANAAVDLDMQVIGYDPFLKDASVLKPGVTVNNDLDQVFPPGRLYHRACAADPGHQGADLCRKHCQNERYGARDELCPWRPGQCGRCGRGFGRGQNGRVCYRLPQR